MKIIHVVASYPPELGGMENIVKELAERMAIKGHEVFVLTSRYGAGKRTEKNGNLTVHRMWGIRIRGIPVIIPLLPFKLLKLIDRNTFVHVHYTLNFSIDAAILVARLKRAKISTEMHIDALPSGPYRFLNPLYRKLIWKNVLPLSNRIICNTQDFVEIASRYNVPRIKCVVIPNGINRTKFKRKCTTAIKPPVKILFVGRFGRQKNIPRLLDAFNLFQKRYKAVLHIAGEGEERHTIETHIRDNNIANVILEGAVLGGKLADLYIACDIFVLPSDFESFPLVTLEAMASGLPIIASNIPGVRSYLDGISILVEPTPENFAEAMAHLVENKQLRTDLVNKGFEKVTNYDWDTITEKMIALYRNL